MGSGLAPTRTFARGARSTECDPSHTLAGL